MIEFFVEVIIAFFAFGISWVFVGIAIIIVGSMCIMIAYLADRIQNKHEKNMDINHFTVRKPLFYLWGWLCFTTFLCFPLFVMTLPVWGNPTASWLISSIFFLPTFMGIVNIASHFRWELKVSG